MSDFGINIQGQLRSISLPKTKALWPLFETIVNSIQSIEDLKDSDGRIDITVERSEEQRTVEGKDQYAPFKNFMVVDNGEGFGDLNYASFLEAYTAKKLSKGCKGIGRFLWLKAFESVDIKSSFLDKDGVMVRDFNFSAESGIKPDNNIKPSDSRILATSVKLINFQNPYKEETLICLTQLAEKIIEHCLPYFLTDNCPELILHEKDEISINLKDYFNNEMKDSFSSDNFQIGEDQFTLHHFKLKNPQGKHELHLCANNREVKSESIKKLVPNLKSKIQPEFGDPYFYNGYLTGDILDASINTTRTEFNIEENQASVFGDLTMEQIVAQATKLLTEYLEEDLRKIKKTKKDDIDNFVNNKKPQYRFLLHQKPESYEKIAPGLSKVELELELHKLEQEWELEIHKAGKVIDEKIKSKKIDEKFLEETFSEYVNSVQEIQKSSLTEHVLWRKTVIDLLEKAIQKTDGNYSPEDVIHSLICPMGVTSDEIPSDEINLWLIDDRLSYHEYLSSDKTFNSMTVTNSTSRNRMDISIFNIPLAFSEDKARHNSISIIELKKGMRDNYKNDNPIDQILGYVRTLRSGSVTNKDGRPVIGVEQIAFHCYVVADLTSSLIQKAENSGLIKTIDGEGFFGYNQPNNAYIQILSYDKIIADAKKRNQVFFDKLLRPKVTKT